MKQNIAIVVALVAVVISLYAVGTNTTTSPAPLPGGVTNYDEITLKANPVATTTLTLQAASNSQGGCIEIQPTSTLTTVSSRFSVLGATSTFAGTMYFAFGACK